MPFCPKIVLHSKQSYQPDLDTLIGQFIKDQVHLVYVVGGDCQRIEDIIDDLCVGDGSDPYFMITTSHPDETLEEVMEFAELFSEDKFGTKVEMVEL